jgi:hypothetical protein
MRNVIRHSAHDHTFTNLSPLLETICCASGLKATDKTLSACPASDATSFPPDADHNLHQLVCTSRNNMLPIWTEGDRANVIRVSSQRRNLLPRDIDHNFTKLSAELPETICCPSGLKATERTILACPASDATSFLEGKVHTFTNLSLLPETICCPSGLKATDQT